MCTSNTISCLCMYLHCNKFLLFCICSCTILTFLKFVFKIVCCLCVLSVSLFIERVHKHGFLCKPSLLVYYSYVTVFIIMLTYTCTLIHVHNLCVLRLNFGRYTHSYAHVCASFPWRFTLLSFVCGLCVGVASLIGLFWMHRQLSWRQKINCRN